MIELLIGSTAKYAGKTMAALGILDFWKRKGLKIGYFKPIGKNLTLKEDRKVEEDVLLIKEQFSLDDDPSVMCPLLLDHQAYIHLALGKLGDVAGRVYQSYEELKKGKDAVLIGGGQDLQDGFSVGVSNAAFIEKLHLPLVLIDSPVLGEINLDGIMASHDRFKENLLGVILNHLPPESIEVMKKYFVPYLEAKGIKVWGLIPSSPKLRSLAVGEIRELLAGNILCGEDSDEELVENFMVGAMNVESALKYFRSQGNKAVITGGDRTDIQLAALETPTKVLVLTGGLYPNHSVIKAAQERKVAIMLVGEDTLTVVDKLGTAMGRVSIKGKRVEESISAFQRFVNPAYLEELLRPKTR